MAHAGSAARWPAKEAVSAVQDDDNPPDPNPANAWREWDADQTSADAAYTAAAPAEVIHDPAPTDDDALDDAAFAALLRSLRALPGPCAPPVGQGAFDILYASAREIVVWFASAKEGAAEREVVIPARLARAAWGVMLRGEPVDEATLQALAAGAAGGRWLLALFAQLPAVEVRAATDDAASQAVTLIWRGDSGDRAV